MDNKGDSDIDISKRQSLQSMEKKWTEISHSKFKDFRRQCLIRHAHMSYTESIIFLDEGHSKFGAT